MLARAAESEVIGSGLFVEGRRPGIHSAGIQTADQVQNEGCFARQKRFCLLRWHRGRYAEEVEGAGRYLQMMPIRLWTIPTFPLQIWKRPDSYYGEALLKLQGRSGNGAISPVPPSFQNLSNPMEMIRLAFSTIKAWLRPTLPMAPINGTFLAFSRTIQNRRAVRLNEE